jgi:hypothetical protein
MAARHLVLCIQSLGPTSLLEKGYFWAPFSARRTPKPWGCGGSVRRGSQTRILGFVLCQGLMNSEKTEQEVSSMIFQNSVP